MRAKMETHPPPSQKKEKNPKSELAYLSFNLCTHAISGTFERHSVQQ